MARLIARMNRRLYLYLMLPVVMLLNAGTTISGFFGSAAALAVGSVLAIACWTLVWLRLYTMRGCGGLRPEFAILAIVPQVAFYVLNNLGPEYSEPYLGAAYQTFNLLLWMASLWVLMASLAPAPHEEQTRLGRDAVRLVSGAFLIFSTLSGWTSCTALLFPSLIQ